MKRATFASDVFRAVADPTRRAILELLREGERSAGDLARPFRMSQPAISQHLQILRRAGLVRGRQAGRQRLYRIDPVPLDAITQWARRCAPATYASGDMRAAGSVTQGKAAQARRRVGLSAAARAIPGRVKMLVLRTSLPERPLITHARTVRVPVRDPARARAFYVDKLGFEVRRDGHMGPEGRWLELAPEGGQTAIVPYTPSGGEAQIGISTGIVFSCTDAEATYRALSALGVEFTDKPEKQRWGGTIARFQDPDGNGFVLVQD